MLGEECLVTKFQFFDLGFLKTDLPEKIKNHLIDKCVIVDKFSSMKVEELKNIAQNPSNF
jgi:hypothetical protein